MRVARHALPCISMNTDNNDSEQWLQWAWTMPTMRYNDYKRKFVMWHMQPHCGFFFLVRWHLTSTKLHLCSKFLSLNVFLLLVYYSLLLPSHYLSMIFFVSFLFIQNHSRRQERNSKTVFGREITDKNLVYWTSFFIYKRLIFYEFISYRFVCNYIFILTF